MASRVIVPIAAVLTLCVLAPNQVRAEAAGDAMSVSATVPQFCDIGGSASGLLPDGLLDFGRHFSVAADSPDVQATMPLRCNDPLMTPTITFDSGTHPTGSDNGQRNLSGPDGTLIAYRLLRGPARDAPPWDDQGYSVPLAADGTGLFSVFGYIPIIPVGTADGHYTDTVVVRVDY